MGDSAFRYTMVPNTKSTRWFLDDFLHTRMLYRALHASGQSRNYVVQVPPPSLSARVSSSFDITLTLGRSADPITK